VVDRLFTGRVPLLAFGALAALYTIHEAFIEAKRLAAANGFGSDFGGTIWRPDRAVLHWVSPYPVPHVLGAVPAIYPPPIYLATLPLGWLSLHAATWVWFGVLTALACGTLAVLEVRDPWCYVLMLTSLPVVDALVLGNASIVIGFLLALAWRFRDRPLLGPLTVAGAIAIKSWVLPMLAWLLIRRPRAALRCAAILVAAVLASWAAIGLHGLVDYPRLLHDEARSFVYGGTLFVSALVQLDVPVKVAAAAGIVGGAILLALAALRAADEVQCFSLALLAALVATPVGWPHYLILMAIPIAIAWPSLSPAWLWFPALWLSPSFGSEWWGEAGGSVVLCVLATAPVVMIAARRSPDAGGQLRRPSATARQASQSGQP
jgi:hypothetical protein